MSPTEKLNAILAKPVVTGLSSGNALVSGAGGLRFKSRAGQIGHRVRHRCDNTSKEAVLPGRNDAEKSLPNLLHAFAQ